MNPDQFWNSQDGQILTVKNKDERSTTLTLAFWPRNPAEFESIKLHLADLKFTERSSLARIGIEMHLQGAPVVDGNRLLLTADAFIYDLPFNVVYGAQYKDALVHLKEPFTREPLGWAIRKGDPDFLNWLDHFQNQIRNDGTYDALYNKWFEGTTWLVNVQGG
mgnify:CR=1 FL=1